MTIIAVPELRRYAPDALRMLGIPLGQADESADMLVWTEAVHGGALAWIRTHRARLNWIPRPRARVVDDRGEETVVEARGGSLLELGVRIIDFVCAEAAAEGHCRVRLRNVHGTPFLPYLTARAAERGVLVETDVQALGGRPAGELVFEARTQDAGPLAVLDHPAYRDAVERGIELDDADIRTVLGLFEMLRVPTSERSRSHAG